MDTQLFDEDDTINLSGWQLDRPSALVTMAPELLTVVFAFALSPDGNPRIHYTMSDCKVAWRSLSSFMLVCKYWRDCIALTPTLWHIVQFHGDVPPAITQIMLRRSGNAPLELTACYKDAGPWSYTDGLDVDMLAAHLRHVQRLHTRMLHLCRHALVPGRLDAPELRVLRAEVLELSKHLPIPLISPTFPLPHLQAIRTRGVTFHHISPFFRPTLRRLHLERAPYKITPTVKDLLNALNAMPNLEELTLLKMFHHYTGSFDTLPDITLGHLRSLRLEICKTACCEILEHLTFPHSVVLSRRFHCWGIATRFILRESSEATVARFFRSAFAKLMGDGVLQFQGLPSITGLTVEMRGQGWVHTVALYDDSISTVEPSFLIRNYNCDEQFLVDDILECLCGCLPPHILASVRRLSITGDLSNHYQDGGVITRLTDKSRGFVNLETLDMENTRGIWKALVSRHCQRHDSATSRSYEPAWLEAELLPFQKLHTMIIRDAYFRLVPREKTEGDFLWLLRDMLRVRKQVGVPIRSLEIVRGQYLEEDDVEMLSEYVEEVIWDHFDWAPISGLRDWPHPERLPWPFPIVL